MLVTILSQKYRVGCERGIIAEERPRLFTKLNLIIEWDKCDWPEDKDGNPNTKFLGDDPELKPGDCFCYDGNVIALDRQDRLVLLVSETGSGALKRICDEIIDTEFSYFSCNSISDINYSVIKGEDIPVDFIRFPAPYYQMRLFHEKFSFGRIKPGDVLKCDVRFAYPLEVYIDDWGMYFDKETAEEKEMVEYLTKEILGWFYMNNQRILPPKPPKEEENKKEIDN